MTPSKGIPPQWPLSRPAKIVFVGEAPSDEEMEKRVPLVGPAGRVFNAMLRTAGMVREEYGVTNVFDTQLPGNSVKAWCAQAKEAKDGGFADQEYLISGAGYLRPEYRWHLARLREELEKMDPTVIVPLGGTALWAFTGLTGIASLRGAPGRASKVVPGRKIFPTFHPAFVIHQWKFFPVVVGDFVRAQEEAELGPQLVFPRRELVIQPTLAEVAEYMPRLRGTSLLSVDIETRFGQITCIGFAPDPEHALTIPFWDYRKANHSYWATLEDEKAAWNFVRELLTSDVPKLGQFYSGYDAHVLRDKPRIETRNLREDLRLLHHALYPELPKKLEFMGASYGRQGAWKHWGHRSNIEKKDD